MVPASLQTRGLGPRDCNKGWGRAKREGNFSILGKIYKFNSSFFEMMLNICLPLSLSRKSFPQIRNFVTRLIRGRKSIRLTQWVFVFADVSAAKNFWVREAPPDKIEENILNFEAILLHQKKIVTGNVCKTFLSKIYTQSYYIKTESIQINQHLLARQLSQSTHLVILA